MDNMHDNNMQENNNIVSDEFTTLLDIMQSIVIASEGHHLEPMAFYLGSYGEAELKYLMSQLELTEEEAVIYSILCEFSAQKAVSLFDIGRHLHCPNLDMLQHKPAVDRLVERGFVIEDPIDRYFVPKEVLKALSYNHVWEDKILIHTSDNDLYRDIKERFFLASKERVSKLTTYKTVLQLLDANAGLHFASTIKKYQSLMDEDEFMFLIYIVCNWLIEGDDGYSVMASASMLRNRKCINKVHSKLLCGTSPLQTEGIIRTYIDKNCDNDLCYVLTAKTKQLFCPVNTQTPDAMNNLLQTSDDFDAPDEDETAKTASSSLLTPDHIVKRQLYYNPATARQVKELATLLDEKKMTKVLHRLKSSGLRCGFACLFHGGPGTGKTETVLQLARQTGRAVFQVEVSQLRSKWHGESERIVKGVFNDYRRAAAQADKAPIMLFNEADAIFTRRMENAERTIDKSENAIQNIILQEIENLDGILIATTNLQGNLDPAFERRFLYKIEFETPDAETRSKIWHSMMPSVKIADAQALAKQFPDLAGGHIENIARKTAVAHVLHGRRTSWDELTEMCRQELLNSRKHNAIGFKPLSNQQI